MCVDDDDDENAISKKPPLLIAQDTNNAQNTQHKLGVAFEVRERNYCDLVNLKSTSSRHYHTRLGGALVAVINEISLWNFVEGCPGTSYACVYGP